MPEDGDLVHEEHSAEPHPAYFDQQVSKLQDMLPKAKAFIACVLVPDEDWTDEHQSCYTHVMIGETPGMRTAPFLQIAIQDIVETANALLMREAEDGRGDTPEG